MGLGATILALDVPDAGGKFNDVVLGYDSAEAYLANTSYLGAVVGRFANRIAGGTFRIDDATYHLPANAGRHLLHGGRNGFDTQIWTGHFVETHEGAGVCFARTSPDGEQGFPGEVDVSAQYVWTTDNRLIVDFAATSTAPTPFNIAQHSYFNLRGAAAGSLITDHLLQINADHMTPVDATLIPTGAVRDVMGTPFDFRCPKRIGDDIARDDEQLRYGGGYDHNWVLNGHGMREVAVLFDPPTRRRLSISTDQPGLQLYTGNALAGGWMGKGGIAYQNRSGVALETQHFPDSPNHPHFPNTILRPGKPFHSRTIFTFSVDA